MAEHIVLVSLAVMSSTVGAQHEPSASCWADLGFCRNAVAESFYSSLKKERIKRHIYATRQDAKSDMFDYIEGFYNRVRRHGHLDQLSPMVVGQLRTGS